MGVPGACPVSPCSDCCKIWQAKGPVRPCNCFRICQIPPQPWQWLLPILKLLFRFNILRLLFDHRQYPRRLLNGHFLAQQLWFANPEPGVLQGFNLADGIHLGPQHGTHLSTSINFGRGKWHRSKIVHQIQLVIRCCLICCLIMMLVIVFCLILCLCLLLFLLFHSGFRETASEPHLICFSRLHIRRVVHRSMLTCIARCTHLSAFRFCFVSLSWGYDVASLLFGLRVYIWVGHYCCQSTQTFCFVAVFVLWWFDDKTTKGLKLKQPFWKERNLQAQGRVYIEID